MPTPTALKKAERARVTGLERPALWTVSTGAPAAKNFREASIGITVSATPSDTSSEKVTVRAWSPNIWPATPSTNTIGTNTQTVVMVLAITARPTSEAPARAASTTPRPWSRRRWIASRTTIELSSRRPMPSVMPPSDMMLSDTPATYIRKKVATTETGMEIPMISVFGALRRNRNRTTIASEPPIRAVSITADTESRM